MFNDVLKNIIKEKNHTAFAEVLSQKVRNDTPNLNNIANEITSNWINICLRRNTLPNDPNIRQGLVEISNAKTFGNLLIPNKEEITQAIKLELAWHINNNFKIFKQEITNHDVWNYLKYPDKIKGDTHKTSSALFFLTINITFKNEKMSKKNSIDILFQEFNTNVYEKYIPLVYKSIISLINNNIDKKLNKLEEMVKKEIFIQLIKIITNNDYWNNI